MKKEFGRLFLLTASLILLRKLKPDQDKVVFIFYAHLLELVIDLLLFGY